MLIIVFGYLIVGAALLCGPGSGQLTREVRSVRGSDLASMVTGRPSVPQWKVVVFAVIISTGFVVAWPLFLPGLLSSWQSERRWRRKHDESHLEYEMMGGAGSISCGRCGFQEEIVSFTHGHRRDGEPCGTSGYQCLGCGKFHSVNDDGLEVDPQVPRCECGGVLSREHALFCPKCRSTKLSYEMAYIT